MNRLPPERWEKVKEIFEAAMNRDPAERNTYLADACAADAELRREVESLLAAHVEDDPLVGRVVERTVERALSPLREGATLGPYRLLSRLGEGGMGTVYLAERFDEAFRMKVAIKVMRGGLDSVRARERFQEERRILAALEHVHIARVLDGGSTDDDLPYLVMEYVAGESIDVYCEGAHLDLRARIALFQKICDAVDHAHRQLVVHRDIKPANVLVTAEGVPKLLDFGIAKLLEEGPSPGNLTMTGLRPMTPEYASPEQIRGEPVTTATDVHALGILLYELLTGRHPFTMKTRTPAELEAAILDREPDSPSTAASRGDDDSDPGAATGLRALSPAALRRELAGDLDNIILKALAKEPDRRYPSAAELSADLRRYLEGHPVHARPATFSYRAGKFLQRNVVGVTVAAAFLATIVTAGVVSTRAYLRADRMRVEAETQRDRLEEVNNFLAATFRAASPEERQSQEEVTAREILDAGAERAAIDLKDRPEIAAAIQAEIGRRYYDLGLLERAEGMHRAAIEGLRSAGRLSSPEGGTALTYLGQTLTALGRNAEAKSVLREAMGIAAAFEGADAEIAHEARRSLAHAHLQLGEHEESATHYEDLFDLTGEEPFRSDPELESFRYGIANDLALLRERMGDYEEAERIMKIGIEGATSLYGERHSTVGEFWANLAFVLTRAGKTEEAVEAARRALSIHEAVLGGDHLQTANTRLNLADALVGIGGFDEADLYYPQVLEVYRKVFGERHARIGTVQNNIAVGLLNRGEAERAYPRFAEARDIYAEVFGADHQYTAIAQHNMARALRGAARLSEAERLCRETLDLRKSVFEGDHPDVARSEILLAGILRDRGVFADGVPHLREAVRIGRSVLAESHPVRLGAEKALARCLVDLGRFDESEELYAAVYAVYDSTRGPDDEKTREIAAALDSLRRSRAARD